MPNVALMPPIAVATRSGGKVSRMIPNASGKIPPPTPWMTRPSDEHAERRRERAHRAAGREDQQHERQDPAAAEQVAELADDRRRDRGREQVAGEDPRAPTPASAPYSRWISGRAGETTVCESANAIPASNSDRKTTRVWSSCAASRHGLSRSNVDAAGPKPPVWGIRYSARST